MFVAGNTIATGSMSSELFEPLNSTHEWWAQLYEAARTIGKRAAVSYELDATATLQFYLGHPQLVEVLGGPSISNGVPPQIGFFARSITPYWGRRSGYYVAALARGLSTAAEFQPDAETKRIANRLAQDARKLAHEFRAKRRSGDTLIRSLRCGHGLTNFHKTYIDPVLFSALIALNALDSQDWKRNEELGINTPKEWQEMRDRLLEIIEHEVGLYTNAGAEKSKVLADDSTLWWGVYELIKRRGQRFRLPGANSGRGMTQAASLVLRLVKWTLGTPIHPDFEMARTEATPEIHCQWRTEMLIIQNSLGLLSVDWPKNRKRDVLGALSAMIAHLLTQARDEWEAEAEMHNHGYFLGLGLEVLSRYLLVCRELGHTPSPFSRLSAASELSGPYVKKEIAGLLHMSVPTLNKRARAKRNPVRLKAGNNRQEWYVDKTSLSATQRNLVEKFERDRSDRLIERVLKSSPRGSAPPGTNA